MKTIAKIALVALTISSVSFVGCKKGEGDPFLSLTSRKARLAGEWKVTKGEGTSSGTQFSVSYTETLTYDGATETSTVTTAAGSATTTDKYTSEYTFEKDGSFTLVYTDNNGSSAVVSTTSGQWNFTGGVGEMKNKSQVVLYIESQTSGSNTVSYEGASRPTIIFDLYQLKGKEIILIDKGTESTNSETHEYKWTLEPK